MEEQIGSVSHSFTCVKMLNEWTCFQTTNTSLYPLYPDSKARGQLPFHSLTKGLLSLIFFCLCWWKASALPVVFRFPPNASTFIQHRSSLLGNLSVFQVLTLFHVKQAAVCAEDGALQNIPSSQGSYVNRAASGRNVWWDKQGWREKSTFRKG